MSHHNETLTQAHAHTRAQVHTHTHAHSHWATDMWANLHFPELKVRTHTRGPVMRWRQLRGLFQLRSSLSGSTTGTVRSSNNSKGIYLKHRQVRFTFLIKGYVKSCTKYNETCKIYTFNSYFHLPFNQHLDLFFKESAALYFSLQKCFNSLIFSQYCILCKYST